MLTGLAVAIAFRAGIWNIGAEASCWSARWWSRGSAATSAVGRRGWRRPAVLLAAALGGAAWAGLAGVLYASARGVDEVISTIMLQLRRPRPDRLAGARPADGRPAPIRRPTPSPRRRLPPGRRRYRLHAGLLLALLAALGAWGLLFRTVLGFEMRAAGLNLVAARLAGLRTTGALLRALALSGALAGLAGGIEVSAITFRLYDNFSPGYGFTAIAVALLGRLHPFGVVLAALLFGALDVGSAAMQRVAGVSSVLVSAVQAIVILALLALERRRGTAVAG
ncbi:MAG: ABC transporter permease [Candidatus Binatia bacterium]